MQKCLRKQFDELADVIYTRAVVFKPIEQLERPDEKRHEVVDIAVWDTGAQMTIISPRIVKALNLKPIGKGMVMGIGGDGHGDVYKVHLGFENAQTIYNLEVISYDIEEYDVLIGMDVIKYTDFLITNNPDTVFSFRYPSEGGVELG